MIDQRGRLRDADEEFWKILIEKCFSRKWLLREKLRFCKWKKILIYSYPRYSLFIVWWGSVVPYKNHMIGAHTRVLMYLASSWTIFEHNHSFTVVFYGSDRFYGSFTGFTDRERTYERHTGLWTEIFLQTQHKVISLVCFGFESIRWPTHCPDDRALW